MGLHYENLDAETRALMLEELELDVLSKNLLQSAWLSAQGQSDWAQLMRVAIQAGDDNSLAAALQSHGRLNQTAERRKPKGGFTTYRVPVTAAGLIAEGEFNRYYVRGVCRRVLDSDGPDAEIEIYRGKAVSVPRPESQSKIGQRFSASAVLADLRGSVGLEPTLGLPPGPNSGLTAKLPR